MDDPNIPRSPSQQLQHPDECGEDIAIILAKAYAIARARARQVRAERPSQSPAKLDMLPAHTDHTEH